MFRATRANDVVARQRTVACLRPLLKHRLYPFANCRTWRGDLRLKVRQHEAFRRFKSVCEIDGTDDRFERCGESRRPLPATTLRLTLTEKEEFIKGEPLCNIGEADAAHDRGSALREITLRCGGVCGVQRSAHHGTKDGVTEKLKSLVIFGRSRLVATRGVCQRKEEERLCSRENSEAQRNTRSVVERGVCGLAHDRRGGARRPAGRRTLRLLLDDRVDRVLHRLDLSQLFVCNRDAELLLKAHSELN